MQTVLDYCLFLMQAPLSPKVEKKKHAADVACACKRGIFLSFAGAFTLMQMYLLTFQSDNSVHSPSNRTCYNCPYFFFLRNCLTADFGFVKKLFFFFWPHSSMVLKMKMK